MVTSWSLVRRVVLSQAYALWSDCVGADVMSAVRVWGYRRGLCGVRYCSRVRSPGM